jgi:hypothetical protein
LLHRQGSRLLRYDIVSDGEIFDQKRIDCADFAYGVAIVIGGMHGDQGPATAICILNVVVFKE